MIDFLLITRGAIGTFGVLFGGYVLLAQLKIIPAFLGFEEGSLLEPILCIVGCIFILWSNVKEWNFRRGQEMIREGTPNETDGDPRVKPNDIGNTKDV